MDVDVDPPRTGPGLLVCLGEQTGLSLCTLVLRRKGDVFCGPVGTSTLAERAVARAGEEWETGRGETRIVSDGT